MHQTALIVHAYVRLHAKVPLIAFASLAHLRITLAIPVLAGGWGCNQAGIDGRTFTQE
jgi:hypothetical protein